MHIRTVIDGQFAALFKTDFFFYISAKELILIPLHFSQLMFSSGEWTCGFHKMSYLTQQLPH